MMGPVVSTNIAVLDIGKTSLKLLVASEEGWPLEAHAIPNVPMTQGYGLGDQRSPGSRRHQRV